MRSFKAFIFIENSVFRRNIVHICAYIIIALMISLIYDTGLVLQLFFCAAAGGLFAGESVSLERKEKMSQIIWAMTPEFFIYMAAKSVIPLSVSATAGTICSVVRGNFMILPVSISACLFWYLVEFSCNMFLHRDKSFALISMIIPQCSVIFILFSGEYACAVFLVASVILAAACCTAARIRSRRPGFFREIRRD